MTHTWDQPLRMTEEGVYETFRAEFLPARDIARKLGFSVKTIRRHCRIGYVPAVKVNGDWRIPAGFLFDLEAAAYTRLRRLAE